MHFPVHGQWWSSWRVGEGRTWGKEREESGKIRVIREGRRRREWEEVGGNVGQRTEYQM